MKSLSRNVVLTMFLAFAVGSIYGCAEKPITFAGPRVQIWKLNIVYDSGVEIKDQTLVLKSSETEKDVFHVTVTIDTEWNSIAWGNKHYFTEWKGEIRNGAMICNIYGTLSVIHDANPGGSMVKGTAKGTFSKRRPSGTLQAIHSGGVTQGKWTAEKIS